jgi:hypothetical protein
VVAHVATALASGAALHSIAAPVLKVTLPVADAGATVAVNVTGSPTRLGLSDETSEVVVPMGVMDPETSCVALGGTAPSSWTSLV